MSTKENLTAIIVDDIDLARISLRADINDHCPELDIVGEADGVVSGAKLLRSVNPDIAFLDIEMNDGIGFDILDIIPELDTHVIFVTGSQEYAIKAFQYSAVDYLLKPVDGHLLQAAVQKLKQKPSVDKQQLSVLKDHYSSDSKPTKLALHTTEQITVAEIDNIVRLESMGNYTQFYFYDGSKLLITKTLKTYESILSESSFVRVHQSHLVNMNYVKAYVKTEGGYILMKDESIVPVSVRKKSYVVDMLG